MRSYEVTAKTVEKAIKEGLETLGKKQEEVDIKILSEGGFLKKAKIVINIEDEILKTNFAPASEKKPEPVQEVKEEPAEEPLPVVEIGRAHV